MMRPVLKLSSPRRLDQLVIGDYVKWMAETQPARVTEVRPFGQASTAVTYARDGVTFLSTGPSYARVEVFVVDTAATARKVILDSSLVTAGQADYIAGALAMAGLLK